MAFLAVGDEPSLTFSNRIKKIDRNAVRALHRPLGTVNRNAAPGIVGSLRSVFSDALLHNRPALFRGCGMACNGREYSAHLLALFQNPVESFQGLAPLSSTLSGMSSTYHTNGSATR